MLISLTHDKTFPILSLPLPFPLPCTLPSYLSPAAVAVLGYENGLEPSEMITTMMS